jgi:hypothetical protein
MEDAEYLKEPALRDLVRGATRAGKEFRKGRGNYSSLALLKRSHARVFDPSPSLALIGMYSQACMLLK